MKKILVSSSNAEVLEIKVLDFLLKILIVTESYLQFTVTLGYIMVELLPLQKILPKLKSQNLE